VLVLAVAGGAWALFGRDSKKTDTAAIGPTVPSATAPQHPVGPVVPGITPKATPSPGPVATASATAPAVATASPKPAPTKAPVATPSAKPPTSPAPQPKPVSKPPVTAPQQGGTVTKKPFTFKVARGDTLWALTKTALHSTGRSTSNANVVAYVAKFYSANKAQIGSDPNLILVGMTISWPASL
jgi:nucleoid-associated protein YgaU